ncbi:MAG: hypothetical protein PHC51_03280 [bacterium]|nr:hypothetical protein [bacterium]
MEERLYQLSLPYLSYSQLLDIYSDYRSPKSKLQDLQKKGDIVKIKRGLYALGDVYNRPVSREVLANMLYGPSYISLEYALSWHGLIPERVTVITSLCFKRRKSYDTPFGVFDYRQISRSLYGPGILRVEEKNSGFLIASKEKALADFLYFCHASINSSEEVMRFLLDDLRVDESEVLALDLDTLHALCELFSLPTINYLYQAVSRVRK